MRHYLRALRPLSRVWPILLMLLIVAAALSQSAGGGGGGTTGGGTTGGPAPFGILIPAGNGPLPNYFSGTNCRVSGSAQIGDPITYACLKLNGEIVDEFYCDPYGEEVMPMSIALGTVFDSSHWPNGTAVSITMDVVGFYNGLQTKTVGPVYVRNKLIMFEHPDLHTASNGNGTVSTKMTGKNYSMYSNGGSWTPSTYFSEMNGANAVFTSTHGSPSSHWAGNSVSISPADYESNRMAHIGSGIPPYNSGAPSVNFMHLYACNCGDTNDFIRVCYPYYMQWGGVWMENQAMMAYTCYVPTSEADDNANLIWGDLAAGYTARSAQIMFESDIINTPGLLHAWTTYSAGPPPTPWRDMVPGDLALFYDPTEGGCMRVKTVYTFNNVAPVGWFL